MSTEHRISLSPNLGGFFSNPNLQYSLDFFKWIEVPKECFEYSSKLSISSLQNTLKIPYALAFSILVMTILESLWVLFQLTKWAQHKSQQASLEKEVSDMKPTQLETKMLTYDDTDTDQQFEHTVRQQPILYVSKLTWGVLNTYISMPQRRFNVKSTFFLDYCDVEHNDHNKTQDLDTTNIKQTTLLIATPESIKPFSESIYSSWQITIGALTALGKSKDDFLVINDNDIRNIMTALNQTLELNALSFDDTISDLSKHLLSSFNIKKISPKFLETWGNYVKKFKVHCEQSIHTIKSKPSKKVTDLDDESRPYEVCLESFNSSHNTNELRFSIQQSKNHFYFITIPKNELDSVCVNDTNRIIKMIRAIEKGMVGPKGEIGIKRVNLNNQIYYVIKPDGDELLINPP